MMKNAKLKIHSKVKLLPFSVVFIYSFHFHLASAFSERRSLSQAFIFIFHFFSLFLSIEEYKLPEKAEKDAKKDPRNIISTNFALEICSPTIFVLLSYLIFSFLLQYSDIWIHFYEA